MQYYSVNKVVANGYTLVVGLFSKENKKSAVIHMYILVTEYSRGLLVSAHVNS